MKAIVYQGPRRVAVAEVADPQIDAPTDVIVRLTTTAICGSDLHMYEGRTEAKSGTILGHENLGVVEEVGAAVTSIKRGDRVVLPFNIGCGYCFNCARGYTNACLTANPDGVGAGYGYSGLGPFSGGQAEYLRVPYADFNCVKLPGQPGDEFEDDFVLLADIFPTGFHATELAKVQMGDSVAIFGAGPVGLLAALSATLHGASDIYVVDHVPERLALAQAFGAIPIDFSQGDPVAQITEARQRNGVLQGRLREGEQKMTGVMCGIDAVGYEALDTSDAKKQKPTQVLDDLTRLVNPTGTIGIIGVFFPKDPGGVNAAAKNGTYAVSLGTMWEKGLSIGMGQTPVKRYVEFLRDLIIAGKAKPSQIISKRLSLAEAPDAYQKFDERAEGYTKVVLKPGQRD